MKIKWTESNRITELEFSDMQEFAEWAKDQAFYSGETLEILEGAEL